MNVSTVCFLPCETGLCRSSPTLLRQHRPNHNATCLTVMLSRQICSRYHRMRLSSLRIHSVQALNGPSCHVNHSFDRDKVTAGCRVNWNQLESTETYRFLQVNIAPFKTGFIETTARCTTTLTRVLNVFHFLNPSAKQIIHKTNCSTPKRMLPQL